MKKSLLVLSALLINNLSAATLTTNKPSYTTTDTIKINFNEMTNHHKDWIAIYPANSSTEWKNVVKWAWTQNKSEGTLTFKNLPAGQYEARAFYNNSYDIEAKHAFQVTGNQAKAELSATKAIFKADEDVLINFKNINGATNDWLAIYPADKNNDWGNVVKWKFNKGGVKAGQANFDKLPVGRYEARVFYNNTFKMEGKVAFSVGEVNTDPVDNNDAKILKLAKEHCLGKDDNTAKVLCSNEENIVYVLQSYPKEWRTINNLYRVNIAVNNEKIYKLPDYIQNHRIPLEFDRANGIGELKGTSLITVIDNHSEAERSGELVLLNRDGKKLLEVSYREDSSIFPSIKSIDNGQKIIVHSGDNPYYIQPATQTKRTYDISNSHEAILINEEKIKL